MKFKTLVFRNLKKVKKDFVIFVISFIIASVANLIPPFVTSRIIDCFKKTDKDEIIRTVLLWLAFFLIATLIQALNRYIVRIRKDVFQLKFQALIQRDLFDVVHAHSVSYFDDEMTNSISTAVNYISGRIGFLFFNVCFGFCRPIIVLISCFCIIAYRSLPLAVILIIAGLPIFLIQKKAIPTVFNLNRSRGKAEREYRGMTGDSLTNYKLVRYLGSFLTERLLQYRALKKYIRESVSVIKTRTFYITMDRIGAIFFRTVSYSSVFYFTAENNLPLGTAFFALTCLEEILHSFYKINESLNNMTEISGNMATHLDLLYKPITLQDKPNAKPLVLKENSISFKDVSFGYTSEKLIFNHLNLDIKPNQKVGLIGLSGAGKSTLISLILRNHLPTSGEILLGTQNIADITEYSLHQQVAFVPQDITLFNRTLLENLQIANRQADRDEIIEACKLACIHDRITDLPQGYDSSVGERGILLSGGERQRIAIARAILQNAPILILDEATSSLDSESEIAVQQALENLVKNKTLIAIAHRLSTLRQMDRILVLENGEIKEDGSQKELLKKKDGLFRHFYDLQSNGYISEEGQKTK